MNKRVTHNISWLVGGSVLHKVISFVAGILVARYLKPDMYGLLSYAAAYTTFFSAVCTLGINSMLVAELLEHPDTEGEAIGTSIGLRLASSALSFVAITCITCVVDAGDTTTIVVVVMSSLGLIFQTYDTLKYWFQAHLQSKYCAVATNLSYLVVFAFQVLLIALGKSVEWFALATSLDALVAGAVLFAMYRRGGGQHLSYSRARASHLLRRGLPFVAAGLMSAVYGSTDRLMLKWLMDDASVGFYSLASTLSVAGAFVLSAVIDSAYPTIVEARKTDRELYLRRNRQLFAAVFYAATAMSVVVLLLARPLIQLFYGADYLPAAEPLKVVIWSTAFSYLGVARNAWVVCEDKQRYLLILYATSAGVNIALNLALIPALGTVGAAIASLVAEVSSTLVAPAFVPSLRESAMLMLDGILLRDVLPHRTKARR
ncbi:flippase [Atopobiaceae bacterium HCP3S3_D6]|jgi:O-antigen/teichoic acid export membrane protein|nr:flippase [Olsenella sp.]